MKKRFKRRAVKVVLTTALAATVGGPTTAIAGGIMLATEFIPQEKRKKIVNKAKIIAQKAGDTIAEATSTLYEYGRSIAGKVTTKLVETAQMVSEGVATYAEPVIETIRGTTRILVEKTKSITARIRTKFQNALSFIGL